MNAEMIVLRLVHVLGGMLWIGVGLYNTFILLPAMVEAGPAVANAVTTGLQKRKVFTLLPAIAGLTILSGIRLMQITSGGFSPEYFASTMGRTFAGGGLAAILALVLGVVIVRPAMMKAGTLAASRAAAPENARAAIDAQIVAARSAGATWSMVVSLLMLAAAIAMAIARYL